jgi:hypothetical protein
VSGCDEVVEVTTTKTKPEDGETLVFLVVRADTTELVDDYELYLCG